MSGARHAGLFLDMLAAERGAAKNTLDAYRRDLDDYLAFLAEAGTAPDKAAAATVRGFMASLEERGLKASSAARRLSAVRQFHKFLYAEGYAAGRSDRRRRRRRSAGGRCPRFSPSPRSTACCRSPRRASSSPRPPPAERLRAARMACLLELLYATGLRVSELSRCRAAPPGPASASSWCAARAPRSGWCR